MIKNLTVFRYRLKEGVTAAFDALKWARVVYETHPNPLVGKRSLEELALQQSKLTELEKLLEEVTRMEAEEERVNETFEMRGAHKQPTNTLMSRYAEMVRFLLNQGVSPTELIEIINRGNVVELRDKRGS
jgi:hypothetical protein